MKKPRSNKKRGRLLKPRPDSVLERLTPQQRQQMLAWLKDQGYRDVVRLMRETFGVNTNTCTLGKFYRRNVDEIRALWSNVAAPAATAGVAVTILCQRPGEIKFAVQPLQAGTLELPPTGGSTLHAGGVEVVAICEREGEIKLGVYPLT